MLHAWIIWYSSSARLTCCVPHVRRLFQATEFFRVTSAHVRLTDLLCTRLRGRNLAFGAGGAQLARAQGWLTSLTSCSTRSLKVGMSRVEQVAFKIRDAAKANDPGAALAAYDAAVVEGIPLRPESFNSLLYLCAGGEHWAMPGDAAQQQVGFGSELELGLGQGQG